MIDLRNAPSSSVLEPHNPAPRGVPFAITQKILKGNVGGMFIRGET